MRRKEELVTGNVYHILNKSIEGYKIFNNENNYIRFLNVLRYYNRENVEFKYSRYTQLVEEGKDIKVDYSAKNKNVVNIIAYCLMPTHIHLVLKQLKDNSVSKYMKIVLNSYTKYFNILHDRIGPLWVGKFKNVLVTDDKQLLHLTRYIHLNPTSSGLVSKSSDWKFSSYNEYLGKNISMKLCKYSDVLDINPALYKKFVESRRSYQKELSIIKKIVIE